MKIESYSMLAIKTYQKLYPDTEKQFIEVRCATGCNMFYYLQKEYEKVITKISKLPGYLDMIITSGTYIHKGKRYIGDTTGLFDIAFGNDKHIIMVRWIQGGSRGVEYYSCLIGLTGDLNEFDKMCNKQEKRNKKPKPGIYRAFFDSSFGYTYYEKKKLSEIPDTRVIHGAAAELHDHMDYYFKNVDKFCINNLSGSKACLLHGPQGTGKTSLAHIIARKYADTTCVAYCTEMATVYSHINTCAKAKVPTIVIFEDCETALKKNDGQIKNFLSGIDAPQNKKGAYIIFTTNYPKEIEPTIRLRKGRIDKIIKVGKLTGEYLEACVDLYFQDKAEPVDLEEIKQALKSSVLSGSEVETLSHESLALAAKEGRISVTAEDVCQTYHQMVEEIKDMNTQEDEFDMEELGGSSKLGFAQRK